jgi:hypothetical protein
VFLVREIEQVLTEFLFGDQVRRLVVILRQLPHDAQIRVLGLGGEAMQLHILDHALA